MIPDTQCNRVFFSALLPEKAPIAFDGLTQILNKYQVPWSLLEGTKDIWCRDYMPLQVVPQLFARYKYEPDYLINVKKYRPTITDIDAIVPYPALKADYALKDMVLDGGNIVKAGPCIILTAKIFEENPGYPIDRLIQDLENTLKAKPIFIPWDTSEIFGHSDGVCRDLGHGHLLMTNYAQFDAKMAKRFRRALAPYFKEIHELKFSAPKPHKYSWAYINWLQTEQVLILPKFGIPEDEEAFAQISALMPEYEGRIEMVDATDLIVEGGAFNCCSWTIREIYHI